MLNRDYEGQNCSIAGALEVVGERWTLLIIRDAFLGLHRFDEFRESLGLARNVLTDRLNKLVDYGIFERVPYGDRADRYDYRLTQKGLDLHVALVGLRQWGDKYLCVDAMHVDATIADEVAAAFDATRSTPRDPLVAAAYASLELQTDRLFADITRPDDPRSVRVVFTSDPRPYANDRELINAVRNVGLLEVPTAAIESDRLHPMLGCERGGAYDRFRAVHDILGHARLGRGFDPDGEYTTWRVQERQYCGLARWALATELHAEHSVLWTTGQLPEHRAMLLSRALLGRARRGRNGPPMRDLECEGYGQLEKVFEGPKNAEEVVQ